MKWHGVNVMAILRVALLGRFAVSCESRPVDLQASASRLLAYLTLSFGRMVPRSRVAGALWPDLSESRARANLSTVTWRLQTALLTHGRSDTVLGRKSDSLGLDASTCDVDVEIFKRESIGPGVHLHTLDGLARAARAVDLYRGDLLEDWDEDWCLLEREQLRHRYTCTLRGLSEGFERLHRYDLALRFARKAAEVDPMSETMQRACATSRTVSYFLPKAMPAPSRALSRESGSQRSICAPGNALRTSPRRRASSRRTSRLMPAAALKRAPMPSRSSIL